jgi:hypothetical protein
VVVGNLDFVRIVTAPREADSILIVNSDAMLPNPVAAKFFHSVSRRDSQVFQFYRPIEHEQFPFRYRGWRRSPGPSAFPDVRRRFVGEAFDHCPIITESVNNVNRYESEAVKLASCYIRSICGSS